MDVLEAHRRATDGFDEVVRGVRADRLDGPTPCSAWTVRDLLRHVVEEQLWVPVLLDGARPADVGEPAGVDDVRRDAVAAWEPRAAAARTAWTRPGVLERTVHLSFADVPAAEYCWQATMDLTVHAWDLATALGLPTPDDDDVAAAVLERFEPRIGQVQGLGIFGPPVTPPPDARAGERLVALLGREPRP